LAKSRSRRPIRTGVPAPIELAANRALVIRALLATLILIASLFAGVVPAKAALIIGGLLLLTPGGMAHEPAQMSAHHDARRRRAGAHYDRGGTRAFGVVDMDRQEAALVTMALNGESC
jgi:hypothetical protein